MFGLILFVGGVSVVEPSYGQIVPDQSLGQERSQRRRAVPIRGRRADEIVGGARRGELLFHSFEQFNVRAHQRVYFANPDGVVQILSRVTGDDPSRIFGTLGVNGGADLFLLNPNGIIFGRNARLDISGSFVASTGDRLSLPNGHDFSAVDPQAPPLLTVNVPLGVQWGTPNQGTIRSRADLGAGENLALVAETVDVQGQLFAGQDLTIQGNQVRLRDTASSPLVAIAPGNITLQGQEWVDIFALNHPHSGFLAGGDLLVRSQTPISGDARFWSGGNFRIEQLDGTLGNLISPNDPVIYALGNVNFDTYIGASLHILAGGSVNANLIAITEPETGAVGNDFLAETITLSDGSTIRIDGSLRPTLDIRAGVDASAIAPQGITGLDGFPNEFFFSDFVDFLGTPFPLLEDPSLTATPTRADININGIALLGENAADGQIFLSNQYQPNLELPGVINLGIITTVDNFEQPGADQVLAGLPTDVRDILTAAGLLDGFTGNAGDVVVDARNNLRLTGSTLTGEPSPSLIVTSSLTGEAGDISLFAGDRLIITNGSTVLANTHDITGGGNISLRGDRILLSNNSTVFSNTNGFGTGGDIDVDVETRLRISDIDGPQIRVGIGTLTNGTIPGSGDSGDIRITTAQLSLNGSVFIGAGNELGSYGNSGQLIVNATEFVTIQAGGGLISNTNGFGDANGIHLMTPQLRIVQGNTNLGTGISSSTLQTEAGAGQGGDLRVDVSERLVISGNRPGAFDSASADDITEELRELATPGENGVVQISGIVAGSRGSGQAGNITLDLQGTGELILRDGAGVSTSAIGDTGVGGDLVVNEARLIDMRGLGGLNTSTLGQGDSGMLSVDTQHLVVQDGALISADTLREGSANEVTVNSDRIVLRGGSQIRAGTDGRGEGGALTINAMEIDIAGTNPSGRIASGFSTAASSSGNSGNIEVNADRIRIRDGGELSTSTSGIGNGGDLEVRSPSLILRNNARLTAATTSTGQGGSITIQDLDQLTIRNSEISASSTSGQAGQLTLEASDRVFVTGTGGLFVQATEGGTAGNLDLTTDHLTLQNGATITVSSNINGNAGTLEINASQVDLNNQATILARTINGQGGNIELQVSDRLNLSDSEISASTNAGIGGDIRIHHPRGIHLDNSSISASATTGQAGTLSIEALETIQLFNRSGISVDATAGGLAGDLSVVTSALSLDNNSFVTVSSNQRGNAGRLFIESDRLSLINQSRLTGETERGIGDNIRLQIYDSLVLQNNSTISASTQGGQGGDIIIRQLDQLFLENSSITASATTGQAGRLVIQNPVTTILQASDISVAASGNNGVAGNLELRTRNLQLLDNSSVSVSGDRGQAGSLSITARRVDLNNSQITAVTGFGDGGNLSLNDLDLLRLNNNSLISAEARNEAEGGNIVLDVADGFILSVYSENNDIIASAERGNGGNISITTQGLFGIEPNPERTPFSDITASSRFGLDGAIAINNLEIDPSQSIIELPITTIDVSQLVQQRCLGGRVSEGVLQGEFTIIGRGGLPASPQEYLVQDDGWRDWRSNFPESDDLSTLESSQQAIAPSIPNSTPQPLVEAQAWIIDDNGLVHLIADPELPHEPLFPLPNCAEMGNAPAEAVHQRTQAFYP